jgi:adenylate cyclase
MKPLRGKNFLAFAIPGLVSLFIILISVQDPDFFAPLRNAIFDSYQNFKPRQSNDSAVVIVDVDEASISELGQWPWPRTQLARMLDRLNESGAIAVGFDMVFSEADRTSPLEVLKSTEVSQLDRTALASILERLPDNDTIFADAIGRAPSVLGFFDAEGKNSTQVKPVAGITWLGQDLSSLLNPINGSIASLEEIRHRATGLGSISLVSGQVDDVIRRVPLFVSNGKDVYPAFSIEALRVAIQNATGELKSFIIKTTLSGTESSGGQVALTAARVDNFEFPLTRQGEFQLYYSRFQPELMISAANVLTMDGAELAGRVEGKIVLFGTSAPGLRDIRTTALREPVPGVAVHAQIIDQIMQGTFLSRPDWAPGLENFLAALVTILILSVLPFAGAYGSAFFGAVCSALIVATGWVAFDRYGLLIDPTLPMLTGLVAYLLTTLLIYAFTEREKRFIRTAFQQYLSPDLVSRLEASPESLKLGGEIRVLSLLFLDIRNFTGISERLDPQELVTFLNGLLSPLSDIIQAREGAIDKYIGDSIMAFWNAPLDVEDHPKKACMAALAMLEKVQEMNAENAFGFKQRDMGEVRIGIGISTGEGCVGNLGSASRFDYSVVGDTVNVAARLEFASKDAKWPILISEATARACDELAMLPAGRLELKGKSANLPVFALIGDEAMAREEMFIKLRASIEKLVDVSAKQKPAERNKTLKQCLAIAPPTLHDFITGLAQVTRHS